MVSNLIRKLVLVAVAVSHIALTSPAHAVKSPPTIAAEQQMDQKLREIQEKIEKDLPVLNTEGQKLVLRMHDFLLKLASDIDRDLKEGNYADADKEIKEFAKERKILEGLSISFSDPLHYRSLAEAEIVVVRSALNKIKADGRVNSSCTRRGEI